MDATLQISALDQLLDPLAQSFSPEAARSILAFRTDPRTQELVDELAEKANQGLLTPAEHARYESLVEACNLISVLQAKARQACASATV